MSDRSTGAGLDRYPYDELEVFLARYERARAFARRTRRRDPGFLVPEKVASRLPTTLCDPSREGLLGVGMTGRFVPREAFIQGVLRGSRDGGDGIVAGDR